ncbi:MAG: hypothetical protein PHI55_15365 [Burkholderiaceae bacterium]|nr:hypothetical protein [Burkholderiaceae bacterium]
MKAGHSRLLRNPRALWAWWWLACALALAPALGQLHRTVHATGVPAAWAAQVHAHEDSVRGSVHSGAPHAPKSLWGALFRGHQAADCLLLDQLTVGDCPCTWPAQAHVLPAAPPRTEVPPLSSVRLTLAFHARAPPRLSRA